jgi:hypothetical protein
VKEFLELKDGKKMIDVIILNEMTINDVQDQIRTNNYGKGQDKL